MAWASVARRSLALGRRRIDVVPLRRDARLPYAYLDTPRLEKPVRVTHDHPQSWHSAVLPVRAWPSADDGRVKAYRKHARAGELPPVVLRWVSGLMAHVVVDGHARLIAAELESVAPHAIAIVPVYPRDPGRRPLWTERATTALDALLASPDTKTRFHERARSRVRAPRALRASAPIRLRPVTGRGTLHP